MLGGGAAAVPPATGMKFASLYTCMKLLASLYTCMSLHRLMGRSATASCPTLGRSIILKGLHWVLVGGVAASQPEPGNISKVLQGPGGKITPPGER